MPSRGSAGGAWPSSGTATCGRSSREGRAFGSSGACRTPTVAKWIGAADVVCQPSLVEPFGQALLEALASERSVVATRVGGPPEFVPPEAGVLVDPTDVDAIADGLAPAAELPSPNTAARAAAALHDVRSQAEKVERVLEEAAAQ